MYDRRVLWKRCSSERCALQKVYHFDRELYLAYIDKDLHNSGNLLFARGVRHGILFLGPLWICVLRSKGEQDTN